MDRAHRIGLIVLTGNRCNGDVGVLPEALPPIEPLAAGELEGALDGKEEEAEPALDGFDALLSLGWPFESLQCVETEMVLLLLAPAAGDEADCADAETAPKHSRVVASVRDFAFMGTLLAIVPRTSAILTASCRNFQTFSRNQRARMQAVPTTMLTQ
ncbi:MAG TPA: hypothetical protein VIU42_14045 [Xanthobacteraceae bacterium]